MVDRGFLISGILNDMGVKLHMSSFKGTERTQLTTSQTIRFENKPETWMYYDVYNLNIPVSVHLICMGFVHKSL
jgi:hypothetical protein